MPIDVELNGGVAVVTVNRPDALNAIDLEHMTALRDELRGLAAADACRVVVLTGAGEKAFVAGADIKYMIDLGTEQARAWGALGHEAGALLETMPKPTIAAVNGFALGGGCELALACDLRLASTRARFGQPEINLGILPGWGGSVRLARITSLGFAKELVLTGRVVDATEALAQGLVNALCEPDELMPKALELAGQLAAKSPLALAYAKEAVNVSAQGDHRANLETEQRLFAMLFGSHDQREGMAAFVEKRPPAFEGR